MRRRLYLQVYLAVMCVGLVSVVVAGISTWLLHDDWAAVPPAVQTLVKLVAEDLPPEGGGAEALEAAVIRRADELDVNLSVFDAEGTRIASSGRLLDGPEPGTREARWFRTRVGMGVLVPLADGRWLAAAPRTAADPNRGRRFVLVVVILALVVAAACYPLARRVTRRLERLERAVDELGAGDLTARVPVQGKDEVARLARRFNAAADRIQTLVEAQRRVVASASHELRSPLARLQMALVLVEDADPADPERQRILADAAIDIEELDALVGDLLLASRLEATGLAVSLAPVDLLAVVAEEAARFDHAEVYGEPVSVDGDSRMLHRVVRNLLENARRYGGGGPIEVTTSAAGDRVRLVVADRGPGVPESDRDRIFEPFYRPSTHREGADGGVGLGLALVRDIARAHGGDVRYEPREGQGSRFIVELPQRQAA